MCYGKYSARVMFLLFWHASKNYVVLVQGFGRNLSSSCQKRTVKKCFTTEDTEDTEVYLLIAPATHLTIIRFSL